MYGPVIQGKLVGLRPPKPDDALPMVSWFEDLEATLFLGRRNPPSVEMEKEWLESTAKDPNSVVWVVEVDGRAVGTTGIREIDWKNGFGTTGTLIGDRSLWGKGIGRETMQLRARYAFIQLPLRKLKSVLRWQHGEWARAGGCGLSGGGSISGGPLRGRGGGSMRS